MTTLAERFTAAVDLAMELPTPAQILRRILSDNVDTGLRAASYEARVTGGSRTSHPERMNGVSGWDSDDNRPRPKTTRKPRRPPAIDDALALRKAGDRVLESTMALLAVCVDRGPGDLDAYGWTDAVKDAHLLSQLEGTVFGVDRALDRDVDRRTHGVVERFCDGVDQLERISKRWSGEGRAPTDIEASWTSGLADEDCCRICLAIEPVGAFRVPKHVRPGDVCRVCYDLTRAANGTEPPPSLLGVWHDCDRQGRSVAWRTARARWLESLGVKVS